MPYQPSKVIKTRTLKNGLIWRRRKNLIGQVFSTYEMATLANIQAIKRNRASQAFDHYKLFGSIYISFKDEQNRRFCFY